MQPQVNDTTSVLIVEDHGIVRAGLRMLLKNWPQLSVVGEASNRAEALDVTIREQPNIILLDIYLESESSLSFLPELLAASPQSRVIMLTAASDQEVHRRAVRLGASGIVLKSEAASVLAEAVDKVRGGQMWLQPSLVAGLLSELAQPDRAPAGDPETARIASLTEREREVIALVAQGLPNKHIADRLSISDVTVAHHLTAIFNKLGVASRLELALYASKHGLAQPTP